MIQRILADDMFPAKFEIKRKVAHIVKANNCRLNNFNSYSSLSIKIKQSFATIINKLLNGNIAQ